MQGVGWGFEKNGFQMKDSEALLQAPEIKQHRAQFTYKSILGSLTTSFTEIIASFALNIALADSMRAFSFALHSICWQDLSLQQPAREHLPKVQNK